MQSGFGVIQTDQQGSLVYCPTANAGRAPSEGDHATQCAARSRCALGYSLCTSSICPSKCARMKALKLQERYD